MTTNLCRVVGTLPLNVCEEYQPLFDRVKILRQPKVVGEKLPYFDILPKNGGWGGGVRELRKVPPLALVCRG